MADNAVASHQAWTLYDQGTSCASWDGNGDNRIPRTGPSVSATQFNGGWVSCPVNLGGQFNGYTQGVQAIFQHATVPAQSAEVDVHDGSAGQALSCLAYAVGETGSLYASRAVGTTAAFVGAQKLTMVIDNSWGDSLGQGTANVAIRSFSYVCYLPPGGSAVSAYRTSVCMNNNLCQKAP